MIVFASGQQETEKIKVQRRVQPYLYSLNSYIKESEANVAEC